MRHDFPLQGNRLYKVVYRPPHSQLGYELWELWHETQFIRHLTEIEIGLMMAGYEQGKKEK
jgi:hypothetical protein